MRILLGAVPALFLLLLSLAGSASAAGMDRCAYITPAAADASIRADNGANAGAFIKPEAAQQSLAERSEEHSRIATGHVAVQQRGSGPFSDVSLLCSDPASPSASARCAHLCVYRL